jgi:hypothetical protein
MLSGTATEYPVYWPSVSELNIFEHSTLIPDYENVLTDCGGPAWSLVGDGSALSLARALAGRATAGRARPLGNFRAPAAGPGPRPGPKPSEKLTLLKNRSNHSAANELAIEVVWRVLGILTLVLNIRFTHYHKKFRYCLIFVCNILNAKPLPRPLVKSPAFAGTGMAKANFGSHGSKLPSGRKSWGRANFVNITKTNKTT